MKTTSLIAVASWSFQSVTRVLSTRWRWGRRGFHRVRRAERVVAFVGAHARDVADAVGAEGGDDVVGPAVVERLGVRGNGGADALGDVGERDLGAHGSMPAQKPRSTIGRVERVHVDGLSAGTSSSWGRPARKPSIGPFEVRDVALELLGQPHVLEALGVQTLLLAGKVREVLRRDRRPPGIVALPHLGRRRWGRLLDRRGYRVSDQISISVSSGPRAGSDRRTRCCTWATRSSAGSTGRTLDRCRAPPAR